MRRTSKIIFCVLTIALVICSFTLPCLADNWATIAPNQEPYAQFPYDNGFRTADRNAIIEAVNKAYEIGLFGGGVPIVITTYVSSTSGNFQVSVHTSPPLLISQDINTPKSDNYTPILSNNSLSYQYSRNGSTYGLQLKKNTFCYAGSVYNTDGATQTPISFSTSETGQKLIAYKNQNGEWVLPTSSYAVNTYDDGENISISIQRILDNYNRALTSNTPDVPSGTSDTYTLDIPAIITAIPNGAKQIINNAFGFQIFGINVAGLLSVLLIVTIISFVVKWLMSR